MKVVTDADEPVRERYEMILTGTQNTHHRQVREVLSVPNRMRNIF